MYLFTYIYHKFVIDYDKCPMEHMGMKEKQHKLVNKKSHQKNFSRFSGYAMYEREVLGQLPAAVFVEGLHCLNLQDPKETWDSAN